MKKISLKKIYILATDRRIRDDQDHRKFKTNNSVRNLVIGLFPLSIGMRKLPLLGQFKTAEIP